MEPSHQEHENGPDRVRRQTGDGLLTGPDVAARRRVRRGNIVGYGALIAPGLAFIGLALQDAFDTGQWALFVVISALVVALLFVLPLVGHYRCAACRGYFRKERLGLRARNTVYRCTECGTESELAEWCSLPEILKSKRPTAPD